MTGAAWITMLCVVGIVWGGLALILLIAFRKERSKQSREDDEIHPFPTA